MKNGIVKQITAGYGDLRKSEKRAADYILRHMELAAGLSIDRLAKAADVSQPTVLRMLRSLGFSGYKDFKYRLVSEMAQSEAESQGAAEPMFGYTLRKQDTLEEIPSYMTATAAGMMEETLKNLSVRTYRKAVESIRKARLIDIYSVENSGVAGDRNNPGDPNSLNDPHAFVWNDAAKERAVQAINAQLPALLAKWTPIIGRKPTHITLRIMTSRWGSCTPKTGRIRLNLQLGLMDPRFLEYVLVHEMTHLWENGHGEGFQRRMSAYLPQWRQLRRELNRHVVL